MALIQALRLAAVMVGFISMSKSDGELLVSWRNGDLLAGEELFERYYDRIERFFRSKMPAEVADLVQETFVACVEARDRLRDEHSFQPYLFSVAHNVLCAHLRGKYRGRGEVDFETFTMQDLAPGPASLVVRRREQRLLLEALRNIPIAYQIILELRHWEHLKTAEIAEILALPHPTVRSRLRRAHESLKKVVTRLAHSADELDTTLADLDKWAEERRRDLRMSCAASSS